jgi:hypothetical protein
MMLANSKVVARRAAVTSTRSATPVLPRRLVVRKFKVSCYNCCVVAATAAFLSCAVFA